MQDFQLQGEFIELNVLLKLLGLAPSGGAAKALVGTAAVSVDGMIETRIRRKLRGGEIVRLADEEIRIVAAGPSRDGGATNIEPRQRRTTVPSSPGEMAGGKVVP